MLKNKDETLLAARSRKQSSLAMSINENYNAIMPKQDYQHQPSASANATNKELTITKPGSLASAAKSAEEGNIHNSDLP